MTIVAKAFAGSIPITLVRLSPITCPLYSNPRTQSLLPCSSRGRASGGSLPVANITSLKLRDANKTWSGKANVRR